MSWYDVLLARNMGGGGTVDPAVIAEAVTDWLEDNVDPDTGYVIDDTFTVENAAPDSKKTGEKLNELKSAFNALLTALEHVAWADENGQTYCDAIYNALHPSATLTGISAVYTQSGTVYSTDSLDSLKADLVVTASYDDGTTATVASTDYTLSGTLTAGTSTVTVSYGGKTTTFTVTVSEYSTLPVIAATNEYYGTDGTASSKDGMDRTSLYEFTLDIDALKASPYYDSTNNYMTHNADVFLIKVYLANPSSVTGTSSCKLVYFNGSTFVWYSSITAGEEKNFNDTKNQSAILASNSLKLGFSLFHDGIADSYAYWATSNSGVMPVGVTAGDIIFAGANTPYYGKHNINEVAA